MRAIFSAFIAGEILFLFLSEMPSKVLMGCVLMMATVTLFLLIYQFKKNQFKTIFNLSSTLILGCILSLFLGFIWSAYLTYERLNKLLPEELEGVELVVDGVIDGLTQDTPEGRRFTFKTLGWQRVSSSGAELDEGWNRGGDFPERLSLGWYAPREFYGKADNKVIDLSNIPELIPGQRWYLPLKLKRPRGLMNPHTFDYELWMFMQNFGANGNVRLAKKGARNPYSAILVEQRYLSFLPMVERLRWYLREKILNAFQKDAKYPGVLVALVVGDQNAIVQDDWQTFNATGVGHLISISGLHVTMLAGFGGWLAQRLWRRKNLPLIIPAQKVGILVGFITALIYTFLAGFQIPAQRTMLMVGVVALSLWVGRILRPFDIWWWALWLVLLMNPWAVYTPGFWLSFGAVALILYAMPPNKHLTKQEVPDVDLLFFKKIKESIGQACRVQMIVTIGLIPLTLWWFSQISLISPLANSFAIPIVSFIVTPLAMLGAFLPSVIGDVLLWISHQVLVWMIYPLKLMSEWSWAVISAPKPSWWAMALSVLGVVMATAPGDLIKNLQWRLLGVGLCLSLFVTSLSRFGEGLNDGDFKALVWDIGQGTAVLIKTKHHQLLYDAGPVSGKGNDPGTRTILPYLRAEGIADLDVMAISHRDSDHIGGIESIVQGISVKEVVGSIPEWHPLMEIFKSNMVSARPCQYGDRWAWDGVEFIVWHPDSRVTFESRFHEGRPNELSCVIEVRNKHYSFWLTGDIEKFGENEVVGRLAQDLRAEEALSSRKKVLMAPHHGSKTSSSLSFINLIDPDWVFAQTGFKNRYNHPHPAIFLRYENFGINLLNTSLTGAQIWNFEGQKMDLEHLRNSDRRVWHR
jgi:competence protein ComEC